MSDYLLKPMISRHAGTIVINAEMWNQKREREALESGKPLAPGCRIMRECGNPPWRVDPPNWFERLFGVTLESKLTRAKIKAAKYCEAHNKQVKTTIGAHLRVELTDTKISDEVFREGRISIQPSEPWPEPGQEN